MSEVIVTVDAAEAVIRPPNDAKAIRTKLRYEPLRKDTIHALERLLSRNLLDKNRTALEVLGRHLFDIIFNDSVLQHFEERLAQLQTGQRLRVQLQFEGDSAELASLPWEFMYYLPRDGAGYFLATHFHLVLSRYVPTTKGRERLSASERPLRVLIAVSSPNDLGPIVAAPVIEAVELLQTTLRKQDGDREALTIDRVTSPEPEDKEVAPTLETLADNLERKSPHVLHFLGHGRYDKDAHAGEVALVRAGSNKADWVSDKDLAELVRPNPPRLVFLHLCEGAVTEFEESFAGIAPQLILAGVQAVIAMQYPVTNPHAVSFARAFYRALAKGKNVDEAVQAARHGVYMGDPNTRGFGTPVLYLHAQDAVIRAPEPEGADHAKSDAAPRASGPNAPLRSGAPQPPESPIDALSPPASPPEVSTAPLQKTIESPGSTPLELQTAAQTVAMLRDQILVALHSDGVAIDVASEELNLVMSNRTVAQIRAECLRRLSETQPDHPCARVWSKILERVPEQRL